MRHNVSIFKNGAFLALVTSGIFSAHIAQGESLATRQVLIYSVLADEPIVDTRTKNFRAKGNIALLTSEGFLTGELLSSQEGGQVITLEGNVHVVRKSEKIVASRLVLDRRTGEFQLFDAEIITDPLMSAKEAVDANLLGISVEEVAFEKARLNRIASIEKELQSLRDNYIRSRNLELMARETDAALPGSFTIQKKYAETLRKLIIARHEPNQIFEELPEETQKRLRDRRDASLGFLKAHPEFLSSNQALSGVQSYARIRAASVYRSPDGTFTYSNASVTPCRCSSDTRPIFGISSVSGNMEIGEYAHMKGAVLDVFNVPVLYSPYFLYPVKSKRESGFLKPYFFMSQKNRVVGIPFFLTLGDHADATFAANDFAAKGTRIDVEGRFQLSPQSRLEMYGEYISDNDFKKRAQVSQKEIADKISYLKANGTQNPLEIEDLEDRVVAPTNKRWYARGGWSVPLTGWAAAKTSGEVVSDPSYFSDFSTDDDSTPGLNLLKPAATSKRFLLHEASVEYYGKESVISTRVQGIRDIFSLRSTDTIYRIPRFEAAILPRSYFGLPLSVDGVGTWERIKRNSKLPFVDLVRSTQTSQNTVELSRDRRREPDEPFVTGDRAFGKANILLPLPSNNFINASLGASFIGNEYRFPAASGDTAHNASQRYASYNADVAMPLFSEFNFFSPKERSLLATLRHDFVPAVNFTSIPNVWRSHRYPLENQLFYAEDAVYPLKEIGVGFRSTWTLVREGFSEVGQAVKRVPDAIDPGVGIETVFEKSAQEKAAFKSGSPSASERYLFSTLRESTPVFERWAELELSTYFAAVRQMEFGNNYLWTDAETFRRVQKWTAVPFSFGVSSSYNLDAARTEREKRQRNNIQEGVSLAKVPPWGDIQFSATASAEPLLPFSANYAGTWSVLWQRWTKHATSFGTHWKNIYHFGASVSDVITPADTSLTVERAWGYTLNYTPRSWISFGHAWSKLQKRVNNALVRDAAYNDSEFDTSNTQSIVLTGVQDCLDITFKRQKDFKQRERGALWSVGINMNLFGQKTGPIEVGQPLNDAFQKSN
jgi:hypothetical protein